MSHGLTTSPPIQLLSVTGNTTVSIPANYCILHIIAVNTTANAITGGLKIGTTDGGVDVATGVVVGANALFAFTDAAILKRFFSTTSPTTLFIQAVTLWNSASLNITFVLVKIA